MRLVVIGSGTAVPDAQHAGSGCFIEHADTRLLVDCGPGVVHGLAREHVDWAALTHVGLTHFHNDHIGDLPFLFFAWKHGTRPARSAPLTLFGPEGLRELRDGLPAALGAHVRDTAFAVTLLELSTDEGFAAGELRIRAHATPHTEASLAYRIDAPDASIGITGDTGPSETLGAFFAGVDVLVAECSLPDEEALPTHLSPSSVAALASSAVPAVLVLTHVYPRLDRRTLVSRVREAGWHGETVLACDGLRFDGLTHTP